MSSFEIKTGASDKSVIIRALDSTSGLPFTTLGGGTAGLEMWYRRDTATSTTVSAIDISDLTTSHTDGGIIHVGNGYYRFDVPDAAWAAGVDSVLVSGSATGVMMLGREVQLIGYHPQELTTAKIDTLLNINGLATSAVLDEVVTDTRFIDGLATSAVLNTVLADTQAIDGLPTSALLTLDNIRQQVSDGLSLMNLDHLLLTSATGADVATGTVVAQLAATDGNFANYIKGTESLQALRDQGDAAWITADVNGLATSAVLDEVVTDTRFIDGLATSAVLSTVLTDTQAIDGLATSAVINLANIRQQVDDGLSNINLDHLMAVSALDADVVDGSIVAQLATSSGDWSDFIKASHSLEAISGAAGLTTSQVRQQVDEGLSAIFLDHLFAVSALDTDVVTGSFWTQFTTSSGDWSDFVKAEDSLEVISAAAGLTTSQVRIQIDEGLSAIHLDHLLAVSSLDTNVVDGSIFAQLATSTGDFSSFNKEEFSLQTIAGAAGLTTSQVRQQVDEGLSAIHLDHLLAVSSIDTNVADGSIFAQIATSTGDFSSFNKEEFSLQTIAGAAGLTTSQVRQQVDEGLSAIFLDHLLAVSATAADIADGSFFAQMSTSAGSWDTFVKTTDSLEAIAGAAGLTTSQVRQQVDEGLSAIHLDHLFAVSATDTDIVTGAFFTQIATSSGDWSDFDPTTDSLEEIGEVVTRLNFSGGGAISFSTSVDNTQTQIDGASLLGSETGSSDNTVSLDGAYHSISGNNVDIVYQFAVGGGRSGTGVIFDGYLNGNNDNVNIYAYDFDATAWNQIGSIVGKVAAENDPTRSLELLSTHTGTGASLGQVRIRFQGLDQTAANLNIDRLWVNAVNQGQTVGYANGAVWVDGVNGTAGTESFVNGTADNPVDTWADALTVATAVGLTKFDIAPGTTITLTGDSSEYTLNGHSWSLALGGQVIGGTYVFQATNVTGAATNANGNEFIFQQCNIGATSLNAYGFIHESAIYDTLSLSPTNGATADSINMYNCYSGVAGSGVPFITAANVTKTTNLQARGWLGGGSWLFNSNVVASIEVLEGGTHTIDSGGADVEFRGVAKAVNFVSASDTTANMHGLVGSYTISGTGGTVNIYGIHGNVVDNSGGAVTVNDLGTNINILATSAVLNEVVTDTRFIDGLATSAVLAGVNTNVSAIQLSLSSLESIDGLATSAALTTVSTNVSAIQLSLSSVQTTLTAASNAEQNTQDIQSRLPAALVGGRIDSNVGSIAGNVDAASRQALGASMILAGTAITGTLTTTCMTTDLAEATNDHFNGRTIIFTTGALKYQATDITDYDGATKLVVYTGITEEPINGTGFIIV